MISERTKKQYCKKGELSLIENYEEAMADENNIWECHHRLETHFEDGRRREVDLTKEDLLKENKYYHRPASELILLLHKSHRQLHRCGKKFSDEWRENMRKSAGKNKGKHWKLVDGKRVYF